MQAEDVAQNQGVARLTKVKICGLTKGAVETAVSAGADYIGFVFALTKRGPWNRQRELAKIIPTNVKKVGVFVSQVGQVLN